MAKEKPAKAKPANHSAATSARLPGGFDLFKPSARAVKGNLPAYLWLVVVPVMLSLAMNFFPAVGVKYGDYSGFNTHISAVGVYLSLAAIVVSLLVAPGVALLQIKSVRAEQVDALEIFKKGLHFFWRFFGLGIVMAVLLTLSFIAFIVPFFIVLPRLALAPYFLVDQNLSISEALSASWNHYKNYRQLWGVFGVWLLILLIGVIPVLGTIASLVLDFFYQPSLAMRYEQYNLLDHHKTPRTPVEIEAAAAA